MADAVHILASDPALAAVMRQADGVARSNATVLISGESGTERIWWRVIFTALQAGRTGRSSC